MALPPYFMLTRRDGDWLAQASEEQLLDWASERLDEITDAHVIALDAQGWKIVSKDDDAHHWPYSSGNTACKCPDWCEDLEATVSNVRP